MTGCNRSASEPDWAKVYAEAQHKLAIRDTSDNALIERGFRETAKLDPVLHYKFLLLSANVAGCSNPPQAIDLLKTLPPASAETAALEAGREFNLGRAYACSGKYGEAESQLVEAEQLAAQNKPELLPNIFSVRAWMAAQQKQIDKSKRAYLQAVEHARKYPNPTETFALSNLGQISLDRKRYSEAIDYLTAALEAARKWKDRSSEEIALGNLGFIYSQLGDFARAEEYSKPAAQIAGELSQLADQETWLLNLGHSYQSDARQLYIEAEASYADAQKIAEKLNNKQAVEKCFSNLAQLALQRRDTAKAESYTQQLENLHPTGENAFYLSLDQAEIALVKKDFPAAEKLLLAAVQARPSPPPLLYWRFHTDLGRLYAAEGKPDLAGQWFRKSVDLAEDEYARLDAGNQRISFLDSAPFYSPYVAFLVEQNKPLEALAVSELGRARTLTETSGKRTWQKSVVDIHKIQSTLKDSKDLVLAYFLSPERSYLWAVTHSGVNVFVLPSSKELYEKIHIYNKEIQDLGKLGDSETGAYLYNTLIGPVTSLIKRDTLVTIIPNRYLYHLDFDTLVASNPSPHYWVEDVNIQICSALTLMANPSPHAARTPREMLLIGAALQAQGAPPILKNAPKEIELIQQHFSSDRRSVITGKDAVPGSFLANHPGEFRFIHFTAHGIANQNRPLESAIILSPDSQNRYKLEAPEILKARLNASLVTISSCESAGTRTYDAEGLVGLAWAFMRAGAHQVVAGLWDVDDATTPQLMDDFYTELKNGASPAVALRKAKLKMLRSDETHKRPYYWAALQLYSGS